MKKKLVNSRDEIVQIVVEEIGHEKTEHILGIEFQCVDSYGGTHWQSEYEEEGFSYEVDGEGLKFSDNWKEHKSCKVDWPETFPAVFVYYFEESFDRFGDISIAFFDWVTMKDFENV